MQLEVGKVYRTRDGDRVLIFRPLNEREHQGRLDDGREASWFNDGRLWSTGRESSFDLVALWRDEPQVIRADDKPARKSCPARYRIKTLAEMPGHVLTLQGAEWVACWGGRWVDAVAYLIDRVDVLAVRIDGNVFHVQKDWIASETRHTWHDNGGLLKSWCSVCDCAAEWDRASFKYVEKHADGKHVLRQASQGMKEPW